MKIVIAHGTMGSPDINWFPWARQNFGSTGHAVFCPAFPTPHNQTPTVWLQTLRANVPVLDAETILIGHSIGATFLLHVLQACARPVAQTVFVAPVMGVLGLPDYDTLNEPFHKALFDWAHIRGVAGKVTIIHGSDDPYVPLLHAEKLHELIGGELHIVPGGKHLNAEGGFTALPLLNQIIC